MDQRNENTTSQTDSDKFMSVVIEEISETYESPTQILLSSSPTTQSLDDTAMFQVKNSRYNMRKSISATSVKSIPDIHAIPEISLKGYTPRPSLSRPERDPKYKERAVRPISMDKSTRNRSKIISESKQGWTFWKVVVLILTFYIPSRLLRYCGLKEKSVQQAWREKMTLVSIIFFVSAILGFTAFGFRQLSCDVTSKSVRFSESNVRYVHIRGKLYDISRFQHPGRLVNMEQVAGTDVSWLFPVIPALLKDGVSACAAITSASAQIPCTVDNVPSLRGYCHSDIQTANVFSQIGSSGQLSFHWSDIDRSNRYLVYNGEILDVNRYFAFGNAFLNNVNVTDTEDFQSLLSSQIGKDATKIFNQSPLRKQKMQCLLEQFRVGVLEDQTIGCLASQTITFVGIFLVLVVILTRFAVATFFNWSFPRNNGKINPMDAVPTKKSRSRSIYLPRMSRFSPQYNDQCEFNQLNNQKSIPSHIETHTLPQMEGVLRTMILVPCYSEGESQLRTTLDSITTSDFPNSHKLIIVVADGLVTGRANSKSTPELLLDMIELDTQFSYPPPKFPYMAVAEPNQIHNMAQVYSGWYKDETEKNKVPIILVVKCGTDKEANSAKPGNRGKRDSQCLIMQFLSKVMFDDRMSSLEFELFTKITALSSYPKNVSLDLVETKITPDMYELMMMVDADTKINTDAMKIMCQTMYNDTRIMGLCGETRIANKTESFVTSIQVFEYYISHFMSKSFESMFGSCTCLPGCFSMYRIKSPKVVAGSDMQYWVPILADPDIVEAYSDNDVETLHRKNLLLLGEDRYLTTLMLKNFPKRKLIFVPNAVCKTVVPSTWKVLFSQRRRWINSTFHNLLELVLVRDLCGIFCFSMQFIIALELLGTMCLPASIVYLLYLIFISVTVSAQPLVIFLICLVLGLPAVLILLTSRKWSFIMWMSVYLLALPIWNFALPIYAFWHFDDFSWGETHKINGQSDSENEETSQFDPKMMMMRHWYEWELLRLRTNKSIKNVQ